MNTMKYKIYSVLLVASVCLCSCGNSKGNEAAYENYINSKAEYEKTLSEIESRQQERLEKYKESKEDDDSKEHYDINEFLLGIAEIYVKTDIKDLTDNGWIIKRTSNKEEYNVVMFEEVEEDNDITDETEEVSEETEAETDEAEVIIDFNNAGNLYKLATGKDVDEDEFKELEKRTFEYNGVQWEVFKDLDGILRVSDVTLTDNDLSRIKSSFDNINNFDTILKGNVESIEYIESEASLLIKFDNESSIIEILVTASDNELDTKTVRRFNYRNTSELYNSSIDKEEDKENKEDKEDKEEDTEESTEESDET